MDRRTASRHAALAFYHQVPTIGDLGGVGQRTPNCLAIATSPITGHDADPGMLAQPRFGGRLFAVGQHRAAEPFGKDLASSARHATQETGGAPVVNASPGQQRTSAELSQSPIPRQSTPCTLVVARGVNLVLVHRDAGKSAAFGRG